MDALIKQFAKHAAVGTVAFIADAATLAFLKEVFGVEPLIGSVFSFIVGVVVSYSASMRYVFERKEGISRAKEFTIYMVLSVIGLGLNTLCMYLGKVGLQSIGIDYTDGFWYMGVKVAATAIVTFYNFFSRRHFLHDAEA